MLAVLLFVNHLLTTNQLTNLFNTGFSILLTIRAVILVNSVFGLLVLCVISPLGGILLNKYHILDNSLSKKNINIYSNILLKEELETKQRFIYINTLDIKNNLLENPIILTLKNNSFHSRVDCKFGVIQDGFWGLSDCMKYKKNSNTKALDHYQFNTSITQKNILNFINPIHNIPIWNVPSTISNAKNLGMQTNLLESYYYKQLFRPMLIVLISLIPFYFFKANKTKIAGNVIDTIILGFFFFLCANISVNILSRYINSAMICNILPILVCLFFTIFRLGQTYKYPI
jgi:lipopolysaccharide export system permease protein